MSKHKHDHKDDAQVKADTQAVENDQKPLIEGDAPVEQAEQTGNPAEPASIANHTLKASDERQAAVRELLAEFKGKDLQVKFDDEGSVTFQRGIKSESINLTASDRLIVSAARRVIA